MSMQSSYSGYLYLSPDCCNLKSKFVPFLVSARQAKVAKLLSFSGWTGKLLWRRPSKSLARFW